jgi:hypothetical protein
VPLSCRKSASEEELQHVEKLLSERITQEQRTAISNLITTYFNSMVEHLKSVRDKMNTILKSIKRQERTKGNLKCTSWLTIISGDALPEDRQAYEDQKTLFNRLHTNALELSQWTGIELPEMPEELSDDEIDDVEIKRMDLGKTTSDTRLFQDDDTRVFYEKLGKYPRFEHLQNCSFLVNVEQAVVTATRASSPTEDEPDDEPEFTENQVENLVENVNLSDLESSSGDETDLVEEEDTENEAQAPTLNTQDDRAIGKSRAYLITNLFMFS